MSEVRAHEVAYALEEVLKKPELTVTYQAHYGSRIIIRGKTVRIYFDFTPFGNWDYCELTNFTVEIKRTRTWGWSHQSFHLNENITLTAETTEIVKKLAEDRTLRQEQERKNEDQQALAVLLKALKNIS